MALGEYIRSFYYTKIKQNCIILVLPILINSNCWYIKMNVESSDNSVALAVIGSQEAVPFSQEMTDAIVGLVEVFGGELGISQVVSQAFDNIVAITEEFIGKCCHKAWTRDGIRDFDPVELHVKSSHGERIINCKESYQWDGSAISHVLQGGKRAPLIKDLGAEKKDPGYFPLPGVLKSVTKVYQDAHPPSEEELKSSQNRIDVNVEELRSMREEVGALLQDPAIGKLRRCAPGLFSSITRLDSEAKTYLQLQTASEGEQSCSTEEEEVVAIGKYFDAVIKELEEQTALINGYLKVCKNEEDIVSRRQALRKKQAFIRKKAQWDAHFQQNTSVKAVLDSVPLFQEKERARDDAMANMDVSREPGEPDIGKGVAAPFPLVGNGDTQKHEGDQPNPGLF